MRMTRPRTMSELSSCPAVTKRKLTEWNSETNKSKNRWKDIFRYIYSFSPIWRSKGCEEAVVLWGRVCCFVGVLESFRDVTSSFKLFCFRRREARWVRRVLIFLIWRVTLSFNLVCDKSMFFCCCLFLKRLRLNDSGVWHWVLIWCVTEYVFVEF